jgi:hypothetical protein
MKEVLFVLAVFCICNVLSDPLPMDIDLIRGRVISKKTNITELEIWHQSSNCYRCLYLNLLNITNQYGDHSWISSDFSQHFQVTIIRLTIRRRKIPMETFSLTLNIGLGNMVCFLSTFRHVLQGLTPTGGSKWGLFCCLDNRH